MLKTYLIPFLISFFISIALTPFVRKVAILRRYVARPKEDRWHKKSTALFGGIAIFISFIIPYLFFVKINIEGLGIIICGAIIFGLGLFDDIAHIKPYTKLIGQIIVASLLVSFGVSIKIIPYQIISFPLTILWIVAVVNAFNLLDNMDGLSCGIGAIVSVVLFICAFLNGNIIGLPALILAGSLLGFLRYNFSPAKIFMGDSGSMFIGFMLATMTLQESWKESTSLVMIVAIPALLLIVPLLDTAFVTLARSTNLRKVFQGGKDHISHRMVVLGLSERDTVLVLYFISILFGAISIFSMFLPAMVTMMFVLLAAVTLIYFATFLGKVKVYHDSEIKNLNKKKNDKVILDGILMHKRRILEVMVDFLLICIAYISAYLLRFEGVLSIENQSLIVRSLPIVVIIKYIVFFRFGLYKGMWKYVGVSDLINIFKAVLFSSIASSAIILFMWRFQGFSRAVFIIDWLLLFVFISGARIVERIYKEIFDQASLAGKRVLIYGAGNAGEF
ncbi:glycosyltransferase family 4 protein, partial [Candidatus Omnitrophota bacterium]